MIDLIFTSNYAPGLKRAFLDLIEHSSDPAKLSRAQEILLHALPAKNAREEIERTTFLLEGYQRLIKIYQSKIDYMQRDSKKDTEYFKSQNAILNTHMMSLTNANNQLRTENQTYQKEGLLHYLKRYFSRHKK